MSDVTMQELELETAELLPSRETLHCWRGGGGTSVVGSFDHQVNILGGNNVASGNNISILSFGTSQHASTSAVGNGIGF
jgi:hypothetical protein